MKKLALLYFFLCCNLLIAQAESSLTFSEVMFRPEGSDNEFIEIYNLSETETFDLNGYKLLYYTSSADNIIAHESGTQLAPQSYAVIFEGDYNFEEGIYKDLIPADALILKLDNNAFGSSGMSNSSDRPLVLVNAEGDTLDTFTYSADNSAGYSDEKVIMNPDNSESNWRNSANLNGTPGKSNSVSPKLYDILVKRIIITPEIVFEGDDAQVSVTIVNRGLETADEFTIELYDDANKDSLATADELIYSETYTNLSAGDSLTAGILMEQLQLRVYNLLCIVNFEPDENLTDNTFYYSFSPYPEPNQFNDIVINEFMHSPLPGEPEWIEFYNRTQNDITVKDWLIKDRSTAAVITNDAILIKANGYLVVSEDESINDYFEINSQVIVTSGLPSLNNSGDDIVLLDSLNRVIDTLSYVSTWGGKGGISLERVSPDEPGLDSANWRSSVTINRATPGIINSVTRKDYDVRLSSISISTDTPVEGEDFLIDAVIKNTGYNYVAEFIVKFYLDENKDSLAQDTELIRQETFTNLAPLDSVNSLLEITNAVPGSYNYIIVADNPPDQFNEDNYAYISVDVYESPAEYNDIVINEIMYKPSGDEPEWLELYNNSGKEWDLNGWSISDKSSKVVITDSMLTIESESYLVLCDDESVTGYYDVTSELKIVNLPSLNNSGDDLKLIDNLGRVIDSVNYRSTWGGTSGNSLERLLPGKPSNDSTNWSGADTLAGATPGGFNSATPRDYDLALTEFYLLDEYAVTGSSVNAAAIVKNIGQLAVSGASLNLIRISQSGNETILQSDLQAILPGDSVIAEFEITGYSEGENRYRLEIVSAADMQTINNVMELTFTGIKVVDEPGDIVINELMYAPRGNEPEWIEVYNRSNKIINLENYKVADNSDTAVVIENELLLDPESYFVIAKDSTFIQRYATGDYIIASFPNLNNTGDKIVLLNYINEVIDSFSFLSTWGGRNGVSLERIDFDAGSGDSTNWQSALVDSGGTPGVVNTVSQKEIDAALSRLIFDPQSPRAGDDVSISAAIINKGKQALTCSVELYENVDCENITSSFPFVESIGNIRLTPGDSTIVTFNYLLEGISRLTTYSAVVYTNGDQDLRNNCACEVISPGYSNLKIVINEVHFNPSDGEPEWFEIFNASGLPVSLAGWTVSDILTTPKEVSITNNDIVLNNNEFIVISKDSSIFDYHSSIPCEVIKTNFANLNNDRDGLVIKDANGNLIDSMYYNSSSGKSGYSLERLSANSASTDSVNWKVSVDIEKSTPGRVNSIIPRSYDLAAVKSLTDPEFPVINDLVRPGLMVRNIGTNSAENFSVGFSYFQNNLISELSSETGYTLAPYDSLIIYSSNTFELNSAATVFAGLNFDKDENEINNTITITVKPGYKKKSIVLTEFMARPEPEKGEWIELQNISSDEINIAEWSISDILSSPTADIITADSIWIQPGEYFIVTNDTAAIDIPQDVKLFNAKFGGLGNTEDGIILYDFRGAIIDSLFYDRTWGLQTGMSMERIALTGSSGKPDNWMLSLAVSGSTPGRVNSITNVQPYGRGCVVINEIMYDPGKGNCEFIELLNISDYPVDIGGWQHKDDAGNVNVVSGIHYNLEPGEYFVLAADSSLIDNYNLEPTFQNILNRSDLGLPGTGESIIITDIFGEVIDSVKYSGKWHNTNITSTDNLSLERINPELNSNDHMNWSTCVSSSGGTPGSRNSIFVSRNSTKSKIDISPNPFSPDNDGYEDFTIISYNLNSPVNQLRIKVFDDKGRKVRTIHSNLSTGSQGSVIFDGLDDSGKPLRIGMYIVFIEAVGRNSKTAATFKKVVVVARKF